jgi:hypothetical protein
MRARLAIAQDWLVRAIAAAKAPAAERRLADIAISAGQGLAIYRHAYRARLEECLADDFPALRSLLGEEAFATLAHEVINLHPPGESTLNRYGRRLVQVLRRTPGLACDLARLEWALVEVIHAPLAGPLDASALAGLPAEAWATLRLQPAPALRIVVSRWAIDACYRQHLRGEKVTTPPTGGQGVLVLRGREGMRRLAVSPDAARLIAALARGRSLADALAGCRLPPVAVQQALGEACAAGCFTGILTPEPA